MGNKEGRVLPIFSAYTTVKLKMCTCLEQTLILSTHMVMSHLPVDVGEGTDEASPNVSV